MMPILRNQLLLAMLFAILSSNAIATTMVYRSFNDLVSEAETIIAAKVTATESRFAPDGAIYTFVTMGEIEDVAGSSHPSSLTLRVIGGRVGSKAFNVGGAPTFAVGQTLLLFVQGNGRDMVPFVGWAQGVFHIALDNSTNEQVVYDYDGNQVVRIDEGRLVKVVNSQPEAIIVSNGSIGRSNPVHASLGRPGAGASSPNESDASQAAAPPMTKRAFVEAINARRAHV